MAKQAVYDYSTTAASNTDFDGVDSTGATGRVKDGDNYARSIAAHVKGYALDLGAVNTVGGTGNAITVTLAAAPSALVDGYRFAFNASAANTGNVTLNVTPAGGVAFGAKKVMMWSSGSAIELPANTIPAANAIVEVSFDAAQDSPNGAFMMMGSASVSAATTSAVLTGTSTSDFATPNAIAALWEKGSDEASAGTVAFGEGGFFHVTGTTTITDIDFDTAKDGRAVDVVFDGALTLTHNGTTLQLPGGANIVTAAGDRARFVQDNSDNVICLWYQRAALQRPDSGLIFLTSGTVSSAATLDIVLTSYTGYRGIRFVLSGFIPASAGTDLYVRLSTNGGSSYVATGSYNWSMYRCDSGGTLAGAAAAAASQISLLGAAVSDTTPSQVVSTIDLLNQTNTSFYPILTHQTAQFGNGGGRPNFAIGGQGLLAAAQDTDAIRFLFSSGNISAGNYAVYGYV